MNATFPIPFSGEVLIPENDLASIFADRTTGYKFDFETVPEKQLRTLRTSAHIKALSPSGTETETITATIRINESIYLIVFTVARLARENMRCLTYTINPEPIAHVGTSKPADTDTLIGKD